MAYKYLGIQITIFTGCLYHELQRRSFNIKVIQTRCEVCVLNKSKVKRI